MGSARKARAWGYSGLRREATWVRRQGHIMPHLCTVLLGFGTKGSGETQNCCKQGSEMIKLEFW